MIRMPNCSNATQIDARRIRSILRWVGGKTRWITRLLEFVPGDAKTAPYWEPFLGGASMFFALRPQCAHLSDANGHLVAFYEQLRDRPKRVDTYFRQLSAGSSRERYYEIRSEYNRGRTSPRQAARFLYLNLHSYNGIFRVNKRGEYNVPYGRRTASDLPSKEHVLRAAEALREATLETGSYEDVLARLPKGSFVYLDPPYPPLNGTSYFTHYTADRFGEKDQKRLADVVDQLDSAGVRFMMTNADVPLVRELYEGYNLCSLSVARSVTCKKQRHSVAELVVTNYSVNGMEVLL